MIKVGVRRLSMPERRGDVYLNPTNGDPSKWSSRGNWGLGETLFQGTCNPDKICCGQSDQGDRRTISLKECFECIYDSVRGGVAHVDIPPERREILALRSRNPMNWQGMQKE